MIHVRIGFRKSRGQWQTVYRDPATGKNVYRLVGTQEERPRQLPAC
jgi:hypothetical protein